MGVALALSSAFFFGLSNVYASRGNIYGGINTHEGLLLTLIVNNCINFLLLPIIFLFTSLPDFNWLGVSSFVGAGFFTSFLGRLLLFSGILIIGASRSGSLKITAPLFTIIIAVFILKEQITLLHFIGIVIILLGVLIVVRETQEKVKVVGAFDDKENLVMGRQEQLPLEDPQQSKRNIRAGILITLFSGLSFGIGNVLRKVGVVYYPNPLMGGVINSFASLIFLVILIFYNPLKSYTSIEVKLNNLLKRKGSREYVISGFSTSCAIYSLYFSLSFLEVSIVNTIVAVEALFIILIASVLLKNKDYISKTLVLGAITIITGIGFITLL